MSKHTPGPWHTGGISYPGTERSTMNVWGPTPAGKQSGEMIARTVAVPNARLIAAAPDLLAALKDVLEYYGESEYMPQVKAAIAKAEGTA